MLERPKAKPKKVEPKAKPLPQRSYVKNSYTVNKDGAKAGRSEIGKWRCKTCKFMNEKDLTTCHMCNDEKKVFKEIPNFGGAAGARRARGGKTNFKANPAKNSHNVKEEKKPEAKGFGANI
jgi:hypothetical protein